MKVRGKEEPWCTGPGWYFVRYGAWQNDIRNMELVRVRPRERVGPFETQWACLQRMTASRSSEISPADVFEITQADIEAES